MQTSRGFMKTVIAVSRTQASAITMNSMNTTMMYTAVVRKSDSDLFTLCLCVICVLAQ